MCHGSTNKMKSANTRKPICFSLRYFMQHILVICLCMSAGARQIYFGKIKKKMEEKENILEFSLHVVTSFIYKDRINAEKNILLPLKKVFWLFTGGFISKLINFLGF